MVIFETIIYNQHKNFRKSKLYKTLRRMNIDIKYKKKLYNKNIKVVFKWLVNEDNPNIPEEILNNNQIRIINKNFVTQDKINLEKYHIESFGYGLNIDPTKFNGYAFRKGRSHKYKRLNNVGKPKGEGEGNLMLKEHSINEKPKIVKEKKGLIRYMIVKCPIKKYDINSVYQKVINFKSNDNKYFREYRIAIINGKIFIILDLYKNGIEDGVGNCPKVLHIRPSIFFNNKEKWKSSILKYIKLIGLEYGDIDVLIDSEDKLYIIDVNNAPMGEPKSPQYYQSVWSEYTKEISTMLQI
tara:strand:- start:574 stop:1464 length:891 start_codon:yes stop_codon:yes gene_type:complete